MSDEAVQRQRMIFGDFDFYQTLAMRTRGPLTENDLLAYAGLGLTGEAGEVADLIKKHLFQDHPLDREKLASEAGDVLWYLAVLSEAIEVPLSEIADRNLAKLRRRYPNGFSAERSIHRDLPPP